MPTGRGFFRISNGAIWLIAIFYFALPAAGQFIRHDSANAHGGSSAVANTATTPSTEKPATSQHTGSSSGLDMPRVAISLAIVLVVVFIATWIGKKMLGGTVGARSTRSVQVMSRTTISPKQQLMLVKVGRRVVLVANTGMQMNSLCEISDPQEVGELLGQLQAEKGESITRTFGSLFTREEKQYEGEAEESPGKLIVDDEEQAISSETNESQAVAQGTAESLEETRSELSGLLQRVKLISSNYRRD